MRHGLPSSTSTSNSCGLEPRSARTAAIGSLKCWCDSVRFQAERKDVDELEWSVETDVIGVATADDIRTAGRRVLRSADARQWPFDPNWNQWFPTATGLFPGLAPR
jgi:hypothetical protein